MPGLDTLNLFGYRGRNDDGNETTATWKAAANTAFTQAPSVTFRVRFLIEGFSDVNTITFIDQLQCSKNGGAYANVTTSSSVIKAITSGNVADTTPTTQQMSALPFVAGEVSADGITASKNLPALTSANSTEDEFILQIVATDVVNNDVIRLKTTDSGTDFFAYFVTPTITVRVPGTPKVKEVIEKGVIAHPR